MEKLEILKTQMKDKTKLTDSSLLTTNKMLFSNPFLWEIYMEKFEGAATNEVNTALYFLKDRNFSRKLPELWTVCMGGNMDGMTYP